MSEFEFLATPGHIGYYLSCRVTLLLLHKKATKENTLCFARFCMQTEPVTLAIGERKVRADIFEGHSYGIHEYDIPVEKAKLVYDGLITNKWKDPTDHIVTVESTFSQVERKYTGPNESYRENNFLARSPNGSHWIEFFNEGKQTVRSIYPSFMLDGLSMEQQAVRQNKVMAWMDIVLDETGINFHKVQDRIGNIIFQFPVTILRSQVHPITENNEYPLTFDWHLQGGTVPPTIIAVQSSEENSLVDQGARSYTGGPIQSIPVRMTDTSLRIRVFRNEPDLALYEWSCDCERITGIFAELGPEPSIIRKFVSEDGPAEVEMSFRNGAFNPLHYVEHGKAAMRKMNSKPSYRSFEAGQRSEALQYLRVLVQQTKSPEILLIDPYLGCDDILNILYFSREFNRPVRAIGDSGEDAENTQVMSGTLPASGAAASNAQKRMDRERMAFAALPKDSHLGMQLEFRMRIGGNGFPFHDRFLLFPGSAKDGVPAQTYSIGTSINSIGKQYHVVAAIEHPQEIIDMFNRLWGSLSDGKCLVFKPHKK
jgi:hypothetical protein